MEALIDNHDLRGGELMAALRTLLGPETDIATLLDAARSVNTQRYVAMIKALNFETIFDMIDHVANNWKLNVDDIEEVLKLMAKDDPQVQAVLDAGLTNSVLKFITKEQPGCCGFKAWGRSRRS
jgi:hypothetical protein